MWRSAGRPSPYTIATVRQHSSPQGCYGAATVVCKQPAGDTGSGTIDSRELRATLVALGQTPTEEEVFNMMKLVRTLISDRQVADTRCAMHGLLQHSSCPSASKSVWQVDEDGSGEIEFSEFIKVIEKQKTDAQSSAYDSDTLEAFVALGGNVRCTSCQQCHWRMLTAFPTASYGLFATAAGW